MKDMTDKYYSLVTMDTEGTVKSAMFPVTDESILSRKNKPYLAEFFRGQFRLRCSDRHPDYEIRCPYCGEPMLCISSESIPNALFICEDCSKG